MVYAKPVRPVTDYEPLADSLISLNTPVPSNDAAHMAYVSLAFTAVELALLVRDDQLRGINPEYIPFVLQDRTYVNNVRSFLGRNAQRAIVQTDVEVLPNGFRTDLSEAQAQFSYALEATTYPFDIGESVRIKA